MLRPALCLALIATAAALASAQAPIERRPPAQPAGLSAWPQPQTVSPGTTLLVTTTSPYAPGYTCRLKRLDANGILCRSHHAQPIFFDRALIATLTEAPIKAFHLDQRYFAITLTMAGVGLGCAILGGGVPCGIVGLVGLLGSLGGAVIDSLASTINVFQRVHDYTPIYIAPPAH